MLEEQVAVRGGDHGGGGMGMLLLLLLWVWFVVMERTYDCLSGGFGGDLRGV